MLNKSASTRPWPLLAIAFLALCLSGCITPKAYVDRTLGEVPPDKIKVVGQPRPVQLMFSFTTKGAPNAKATKLLADEVKTAALGSKLFSSVASAPVLHGAVLSIRIDNIPLTENAAGKGFITGLTFGAAGSVVTDGYVCTVDYLPPGGGKITRSTRHAIHTVIGNASAPPNSDRAKNMDQAAHTVVRQLVANGLQQLASDPKFR